MIGSLEESTAPTVAECVDGLIRALKLVKRGSLYTYKRESVI
jgi:hypothetical protein